MARVTGHAAIAALDEHLLELEQRIAEDVDAPLEAPDEEAELEALYLDLAERGVKGLAEWWRGRAVRVEQFAEGVDTAIDLLKARTTLGSH